MIVCVCVWCEVAPVRVFAYNKLEVFVTHKLERFLRGNLEAVHQVPTEEAQHPFIPQDDLYPFTQPRAL